MIFRSPYPPLEIPNIDLSALVLNRAKKFGSRIALIDAVSGQQVSYQGFYESVLSVARGLHHRGFKKRDVFAIYAPNCLEYAFAMHAVFLLGGTLTTANPLSTSVELASQLKDSQAKYLLTTPSHAEKALNAASVAGIQEVFITGESFPSLLREIGTIPEAVIDPSEEIAALPYSSGTTGFPKGVMLTHRNLVANILQIERSKIFTAGETVICVLPLFHIYGLVVILNESLFLGSTIVILPRYELRLLLEAMETYRVGIAPLVPPIVLSFAKESIIGNYDLSGLKTIFSAAAPLAPNLIRECRARIGCAMKQGYGMTEASPATHMSRDPSSDTQDGSVGVCVPNTDCKILDSDGVELPAGEAGEICVRGPQVMKGYLNCPDATAQVLDEQGWLRTGDIGYADSHSNFYIVDRVKELIKYKGFQVAPAEIEAVLLSHPMIADAVVIPCPDPVAGEVPKAFVVLKEEVSLEIILEYVSSRVAPHKRIRKIERIEQIPKSPSGKILRRILVEKERNR